MTPTLGTTWPGVHLYDPTGATWVGDFASPVGITWRDPLSQLGAASFSVPLNDPLLSSVDSRMIVKFSLHGAVRFGCVLMSEKTSLAVDGDGNRLLMFEGQPSIFGMLNDAVIYPEYGLARRSGMDRLVGFMSADGAWRVTADWADCLGDARNGGIRDYPPDFVADNPDFVSVDPTAPVSTFAEYYFRNKASTFTPSADGNYEFVWDFDNFGDLYVNGELLLSSDRTNFASYRSAQTAQKFLPGGVAVQLAAKVENDFELVGTTPLAMAGVVYSTDTSGNRTGTVFKTQAADWIVNDGTNPPGWHRAQGVYTLLGEAAGRSPAVVIAAALTRTFTMTDDSDGNPHADTVDTFDLAVSTQGLADAITQLCDKADSWVNAGPMEIDMHNRKGTDLSATVALDLGAAGMWRSYDTTKTSARRTVILAQMADGLWVETTDTAGLSAVGRVESGMSLGSTNDRGTATRLSEVQLRSTAADQYTVTGEAASAIGPQLYVDYDLGDTITVPGHRNVGTMKARVMSVTVDASSDVLRTWPDTMILDGSV